MVRNSFFVLILFGISTEGSVAQSLRSPVRDPIRSFQRPIVTWTEIRDQNVVLQQRDFSCGAAALATVLRYYWGKDIQEDDVLESLSRALKPDALKERTENGLSLADLKVVSDRMGFDAAVGKLDNLQKLSESKIPLIVGPPETPATESLTPPAFTLVTLSLANQKYPNVHEKLKSSAVGLCGKLEVARRMLQFLDPRSQALNLERRRTFTTAPRSDGVCKIREAELPECAFPSWSLGTSGTRDKLGGDQQEVQIILLL